MHWTNAVAMIVMISSGWKIYNDEVMFGWLHFPELDHDRRRAGGRAAVAFLRHVDPGAQWHRLSRLRAEHRPLPAHAAADPRSRDAAEIRKALRLELEHDDLTRYNAVQRLLYIGIIVVIIVQVLSGLVIWKPVQFSELAFLFYDFQGARLVHFLGMVAIVGFVLVHVALALIVPQTLVAMLKGGPRSPRTRQSRRSNADAAAANLKSGSAG